MYRFFMRAFVLAVAAWMIGAPAQAVVVVTASETGGNVVFSASGSYDITTWTLFAEDVASLVNPSEINPTEGDMLFLTSVVDFYTNASLTTPTFGTLGSAMPNSVTGDTFGISNGRLHLDADAALTGTISAAMTFETETFASLGLFEGSYSWVWDTDRIDLTIGPPATIPLPAGIALLLSALAGLIGVRWCAFRAESAS